MYNNMYFETHAEFIRKVPKTDNATKCLRNRDDAVK